MSKEDKRDLVIIGAGPGGYRAAFMAADLGLKVTLIDPEANPGGVCLYRGCIPTKALLHLAKIKADSAHAADMGMKFQEPEIAPKKVGEWKSKVVKQLTGGLGQLVKAHKIEYLRGWATFEDAHTLQFKSTDDKKQKVKFDKAIIATGVKPVQLPGVDPIPGKIMGSAEALELKEIPQKLLVVGGGYIGLEMASIYSALGSKVSLVELTDKLMIGMDRDLVKMYTKMAGDTFTDVWLKTKVSGLKKHGKSVKAEFENKEEGKFSKQFDKVLVSIGQKPNTENLGLDKSGVKTDEKGFIEVNDQQQTSVDHIWAIGDITGPPLLAHKAGYEGRVAAEAIAGKKTANDARAMPAVVYTHPEIATCGLSEEEAKEKKLDFKTVKFPWPASGRAIAMGESAGFTKLIIHKETEQILGAGIVGKYAGDMIAELVLAMEMGATAEDIALTIHPHPTLSETIMEAAEMFYGHPAHTITK